jgi:hypothetical protein
MRRVRQVVDGEDERLRKTGGAFLVSQRVLLQLLEDLAIRIGRRHLGFDVGALEAALVLQQIELARTRRWVDLFDLFALLEEHAVHPHVRAHLYDVVVDEEAVLDRLAVLVAVDGRLEVARRVRGGGGSQADLDGIEMLERVVPDRLLGRGVATMAFVGNDDIERVDGDVQLPGIVVGHILAEDRAAAEQVDRHPLNRADIDEGSPRLGVGQV